jgi:hypothetical protein
MGKDRKDYVVGKKEKYQCRNKPPKKSESSNKKAKQSKKGN